MKTENWSTVSEILLDCLEIEISERQTYLDKLNLSQKIREEVESLLAFEENVEGCLNFSAVELSKGFFDGEISESSAIGQTFGVYQVISELGYGGMGAVYLAERSDGKFEQRVALKLLKREMNTAAIRRRFQQEREILASLEHPNIARLLDAGTTGDKIPYIAMEYVEGLPIDDFCNKNRLNIEQRLNLFRKVCEAVDFAHRNLVIHRDLKPSNILVTDDGTPKLLDFGISKIISTEFDQINTATVTKMGVMTPSYASPEQLQSKSVTTTTDVYSLGIILYELLSGHRPFENKEGDIKKIYKAVIELDPPLPSAMADTFSKKFKKVTESQTAKISDKKEESPETEVTKVRQTSPQILNLNSNSIRGDLDNIVLKALRKEPERRYLSAESLSEDIKRHLAGLPVTARPNTFSYRTGKFIKRNRASVFAGILILLTIGGGIITTLWQARIAQAERLKAEKRFNDVRSLANSFLFNLAPKIEKLPGSTPAREELVNLALEYLDKLSQEASDDLELQRELAAAYEKVGDVQGNPFNPNIGDVKGALESYEKALKIREKHLENEPENLTFQNELAQNYKVLGEIHYNGSDYEKGKIFIDKSLELREKILRQNPNDFEARSRLADIINSRGNIPFYEYDNKTAIAYYNRAKEIYEQLAKEKPDHPEIKRQYARTYVNIGEAYGWDNDLKSGEENLDRALSILIKLGEKYPNDQKIQRSLMIAYLKTADNYADFEKAEQGIELFEKGVEVAEKLSNADPQNIQAKRDLATITRKLAETLIKVGKNKESLEKMNIVLKIFKDLRDNDPNNNLAVYDVANTQFAAGETYLKLKNYTGGLEILQEAKEGFQKDLRFNPEHTIAARTLAFTSINIGTHYAKLAETQNRREYLQKALENKREGLEKLYKLKDENRLSEYDIKYIIEAESELKEIRKKLGN